MCDMFADFPNFIQDMINESYEMKAVEQSSKVKDGLAEMANLAAAPKKKEAVEGDFLDDDIPF